jgi:anaphase-promoting complex subunit 8
LVDDRAAELLTSLPEEEISPEDSQMTEVLPSNGQPPIVVTGNIDPDEAALEAKEINKYLLAKSFFDCREYDRCAAVFLPNNLLQGILASATPPNSQPQGTPKGKGKARLSSGSVKEPLAVSLPVLSQKSLFLALYAKFLSGEKRKDEDTEMVMGPHDSGKVVNKELVPIARLLETWFSSHQTENGDYASSQGWLEYLYGMVLGKEKNDAEAMNWLIRSVHLYPMNWGAWLELASLVDRVETLNRIAHALPQNIVSFMFHIHTSLELYQTTPAIASQLHQLLQIFPNSPFLLSAEAILAYHSKDLEAAEQHFSSLLAAHPHRLDTLDHYSNILYVMGSRPKLAFLAHHTSAIDRFRPETCVITGNYYSLLSQHEKAVSYFRRALTLDRSCLSAWTLMGHEYVELKNTHAAIESYRRAVDVNRRDYRAWYGLGQTYEMLEMHAYALWYYKRAAGLRPWDGKMWMAVGTCLQRMGREREGIKALKRAMAVEPGEGVFGARRGKNKVLDPEVLLQIAGMFERLGEAEEARAYMELCVAQEEGLAAEADETGDSAEIEGGTGVTPATSKARMWLARWCMRTGELQEAMRYATELCQDGVEVEDAKALVREIRAREEAEVEMADGGYAGRRSSGVEAPGLDELLSSP